MDLNIECVVVFRFNRSTLVVENIVSLYKEAHTFVTQFAGCKIKFIGQPNYIVSLYNDVHGHMKPTDFLESDEIIESRVNQLNKEIEILNQKQGVVTLKFNADLRDCRHKRKDYFFELLEDGLHPGPLLSQKWLRRIQLDVIRECYLPDIEDILDIHVDPCELLEFERKENDN